MKSGDLSSLWRASKNPAESQRLAGAPESETRPSPQKALIGGLVGTLAMTLMMYTVARMMLGHPMDVAAMLGGLLGNSWMMGMAMHLLNGIIIFPLIYVFVLYDVLPGAPWLRGTIWGLILWVVSQAIVTPMMGGGLFSAKAGGMMAVMASLIAHAVYGLLLGWLAGTAQRAST